MSASNDVYSSVIAYYDITDKKAINLINIFVKFVMLLAVIVVALLR